MGEVIWYYAQSRHRWLRRNNRYNIKSESLNMVCTQLVLKNMHRLDYFLVALLVFDTNLWSISEYNSLDKLYNESYVST